MGCGNSALILLKLVCLLIIKKKSIIDIICSFYPHWRQNSKLLCTFLKSKLNLLALLCRDIYFKFCKLKTEPARHRDSYSDLHESAKIKTAKNRFNFDFGQLSPRASLIT